MAFGQAAGPPAAARRVAELAELLEARGFESFKEARHPFGLNQRQASGKFTTDEVDELIARLEAGAEDGSGPGDEPAPRATSRPAKAPPAPVAPTATSPAAAANRDARRRARQEEVVVGIDADIMATELVNRGWCCIPPA